MNPYTLGVRGSGKGGGESHLLCLLATTVVIVLPEGGGPLFNSTPLLRKRDFRLLLLLGGFLLAAIGIAQGCSHWPRRPDPPRAEVSIKFAGAPGALACVTVTQTRESTVERRWHIPVNAADPRLRLTNLTVGPSLLSFEGHSAPCSDVARSNPGWIAGPIAAELIPGRNGELLARWLATVFGASGLTCQLVGATCTKGSDCCSRQCDVESVPGATQGAGSCSADEPPAPTTGALKLSLAPLREAKAGGSLPAFDGDQFFVSFPPAAEATAPPFERVFSSFVKPSLAAGGFERPERLAPPRGPVRQLPGGNLNQLITASCAGFGKDSAALTLCRQLIGGKPPQTPFLTGALGVPADRVLSEIQRPLQYWFFTQREGEVPIEHKGVVAVRYGDRRVSAVFGSVLNRYLIVNKRGMDPSQAFGFAAPALFRKERVVPIDAQIDRRQTALVLLPFGGATVPGITTGAAAIAATTVPALRYAYRGPIAAGVPTPDGLLAVSYTAWVDAETGALLKYSPDFAADTPIDATGAHWCRDPSTPTALCESTFKANENLGVVSLQNAVFGPPSPPAAVAQVTIPTPGAGEAARFGSDAEAQAAICGLPSAGVVPSSNFRQVNVFAHLNRANDLLVGGGIFTGFPSKVTVNMDRNTPQSMATVTAAGALSLTLANGSGFMNAACPNAPPGTANNSAQDATIVVHEFAHLAIRQLQLELSGGCNSATCPMPNPANRRYFHDYSDGFAAIMSETPCIGGWSSKNFFPGTGATTDALEAVGAACAFGNEGTLLPRLLGADIRSIPVNLFGTLPGPAASAPVLAFDHFPDHRAVSRGEYADGQILGAALWHLRQGLFSQGLVAATLPLWGRLNRAVWSAGFVPSICTASASSCDANLYRSGRELLLQLTDAWVTSDSNQSTNKVLSAFARAGLFLAPSSCVDNVAAAAGADPVFCPTADTGADAIVDIDDGTPDDGELIGGVRQLEDDYVDSNHPTGPTFRIWTGAPVVFAANGVGSSSESLCNDRYELEFWIDGSAAPHFMSGAQSIPPEDPGKPRTPSERCYQQMQMNQTQWDTIKAAGAGGPVSIRYKVKTWKGDADPTARPNERDSQRPGAGLWWSGGIEIAPAVFFVVPGGRPIVTP
jgi:hypothetical protein